MTSAEPRSAHSPETPDEAPALSASRFTSAEVARILSERGWLGDAPEQAPAELNAWLERAAQLLGRQASDTAQLAALIEPIFHYEVREILSSAESHAVLSRAGARTVVRELGGEVLSGGEIDSDRLKQIVDSIKERTGHGGRQLFHPLRLALAGRVGEGDLDRVILLLDRAAQLPFAMPVKSARERMLEFCAAID